MTSYIGFGKWIGWINKMANEFVVKRKGELETYTKYEDIPDDFDHLIKFAPEALEPEGEDGNHTEEQHDEIATWNDKLQQLMEIERARSL